jgi:hypothetical protein
MRPKAVEYTFGLVEQDKRNSGVTLCLRSLEPERDFPRWAMAFADGEVPGGSSLPQTAFEAVFAKREGAGRTSSLCSKLSSHKKKRASSSKTAYSVKVFRRIGLGCVITTPASPWPL